jgi:hypothetical protein
MDALPIYSILACWRWGAGPSGDNKESFVFIAYSMDLQKSTTQFSHKKVAFSSLFILTPTKQNKKRIRRLLDHIILEKP